MKNFKTLLVAAMILLTFSSFAQKTDYSQVFVSQDWMQEHINDDNLVLLHVANPRTYPEGHLQGAISVMPQQYMVARDGLYWELPEEESFADSLQSLGIDKNSTIVLYYGGNSHAPTFRFFYTFDYFGMSDQVKILDGGLPGWIANDLPLTTEVPTVVAAADKIRLKPSKKKFADKEYVLKAQRKDKIQLIDARRDNYYSGSEKGDYKRGGHIATAKNICWEDIVDENMFLKDRATLAGYYSGIGLTPKTQVVSYCHVGLRASVIYTMARYLGYDARLYDGSFNEYDELDDSFAVENGN